jgi:hypothetical protein
VWLGQRSIPASGFQAAVDTTAPVRPVALRYRLAGGGPTTVASFVGPASLWQALVRVTGLQGLVIEVHLLPLLQDPCATTPLQPVPRSPSGVQQRPVHRSDCLSPERSYGRRS